MPENHQSPFAFDLTIEQRPPSSPRNAVRLQCLIVLLLFLAELGNLWIRPALIHNLHEFNSGMSLLDAPERRSREDLYRIMNQIDVHQQRCLMLAFYLNVCTATQLLSFLPFVLLMIFVASRKNLVFRYASFLATSVPLAIGAWNSELLEVSPFLLKLCLTCYQCLVAAIAGYAIFANNYEKIGRPILLLNLLPVVCLLAFLAQLRIGSMEIRYIAAMFASIMYFVCLAPYFKLCFGNKRSDAANSVNWDFGETTASAA